MEPTCPQCHVAVRPADFFCYNCGKNLKPKPLPTDVTTLALYYIGTVVLPPLGFWWGYTYLKNGDPKSRLHGMIMIGVTIIEIIFLTIWTMQFIRTINASVGSQFNGLQGF